MVAPLHARNRNVGHTPAVVPSSLPDVPRLTMRSNREMRSRSVEPWQQLEMSMAYDAAA